MAELHSSHGALHAEKNTYKKSRKRVGIDMTAMVDVAFLLLTFFVLTAVIQKESVMQLIMPPQKKGKASYHPVDEEKVLTIVIDGQDRIFWYHGITDPEVHLISFQTSLGLRKVIFDHLQAKPRLCRDEKLTKSKVTSDCWDPIFVIKPRHASAYGSLVDVLDEMAIANAPKYAIDRFTKEDSMLIISKVNVDLMAAYTP